MQYRFDYIMRDNHATGEKGNLSLSRCVAKLKLDKKKAKYLFRLIHSARVIDDQICYDIKDANQMYELCWTRFSLHKRIYTHKTGYCFPLRTYKRC